MQDNVTGIRDIQLATCEAHESERVGRLAGILAWWQIRSRRYIAGLYPLVEGATGVSIVLVVGIGGARALEGTLAVADLVAFVLYLGMLYQPLWMVADVGEALERGVASLGRIREVLDTEPAARDPDDPAEPGTIRGELRFERVSFAYRDVDVLRDVDLAVPAGTTLALVGATGAGKSTLAALVSRFADPCEGRVTLDGHDLRELSLDALRRSVAVVQQDVFLFHASVRENIRLARPDASDDEVMAAARAAHADAFVRALPEGYETLVGERGVKLSGGQKQRLSIARAVLKGAPILGRSDSFRDSLHLTFCKAKWRPSTASNGDGHAETQHQATDHPSGGAVSRARRRARRRAGRLRGRRSADVDQEAARCGARAVARREARPEGQRRAVQGQRARMIAIDTNVLLRYLLDDDPEQSPRAHALIEGEREILITNVVLAETLWTLKGKRYGLDRPALVLVVERLLEESDFRFENVQAVWMALHGYRGGDDGGTAGADFADALILNVARLIARGLDRPFEGLYTFDVKAQRMPGAKAPGANA